MPLDPQEQAAARAAAERQRDEIAAARAAEVPARRAAVLGGPQLRDVEAAVDCHCSCHPRPAQEGLHDGGVTCTCQLTPAERAVRWDALLERTPQESAEALRGRADREERFAAEAGRLGVTAHLEVSMCPFVIVGVCDGRGFYLRERHGTWRVTIAPDDDPSADPWAMEPDRPTIDIAEGDERDFYDAAGQYSDVSALGVAVHAVREALERNSCTHPDRDATYCPDCGVPIEETDAWRGSLR